MFSFLYDCQYFYRPWLYIWVTWRLSYRKQEILTLREYLASPPVYGRIRVAHNFSLLCCVFVLFVFVLCIVCPMLPVSLDCPFLIAPSVFSNVYLSCVLCVQCCQCLWIVFVLCLVCLMLPVSLDCPFLIAPSVFSNVYLSCVLCIQCCQCLWIIFVLCLVCPMLPVSLYCLRPVFCVSNVASVSGLSILDCPFGFL